VVRHMRPTLSELGEYDGTALMEFKTRKTIHYRIRNATACTYEIDDTPPFKINTQALDIATEIALLLETSVVSELHITRKQYLDGSIPTGFQRTAIVGIEGTIPIGSKTVRIIQLSIEEDACREVSDRGHLRIYTTDRLGMPLVETVTYPDMKTPQEARLAAHYIRFLTRSTGKVRTGIGAARQDVNVSIKGGTRVEIKGVSSIALIPELTHNEAFRQKSLLVIRDQMLQRVQEPSTWKISHRIIEPSLFTAGYQPLRTAIAEKQTLVAVNLPQFHGILSFFTQPSRMFAEEIADRLKVIACVEKPNMIHSEQLLCGQSLSEQPLISQFEEDFQTIRSLLSSQETDAQIVFWAPAEDVSVAVEVIEQRCRIAFTGVPNETRKSFPNGTTMFERVLPGPDRMYPDTDSAPIPIPASHIDEIRKAMPATVHNRIKQLRSWMVPDDTHCYLLKNNLVPLIERIQATCGYNPKYIATLLAHRFKNIQGTVRTSSTFDMQRIADLCVFVKQNGLHQDIIVDMLPVLYEHPKMDFQSVLTSIRFSRHEPEEILSPVGLLRNKFTQIRTSKDSDAATRWIMRELRRSAVGNISLKQLSEHIRTGEHGD
ncbi:MAG: Glu-tRNA(Gln) amidotransferase subunit GatE, partial [Chitinivibrionales bacterium]|nr:Glu-tRNA(Gln) amidotransferase subunit GatE [Chitinivibrionales bacterium]